MKLCDELYKKLNNSEMLIVFKLAYSCSKQTIPRMFFLTIHTFPLLNKAADGEFLGL